MKTTLQTIYCSAIFSTCLLQGEEGYTNYVRMIEIGGSNGAGFVWDLEDADDSAEDFLVDYPAPERGAVFHLSTVQTSPFQDFSLGNAFIGTYLPEAELQLITHDPDSTLLVPQTRADQPFDVRGSVSGLFENGVDVTLADNLIQTAATEVSFESYAQAYDEGANSLPQGQITTTPHTTLALGNGELPSDLVKIETTLNPVNGGRGEESFVVRSLPDGVADGVVLAEVRLRVWPVWSATQSGLISPALLPYEYSGEIPEVVARPTENEELEFDENFVLADGEHGYDTTPPEVTFHWNDLYPTSTIKLIVNDVDKPYPWGGIELQTRHINKDSSHSASLTVTPTEWDAVLGGQGRYAVWMVTETPGIGWEVAGNYDANGDLIGEGGGWIIPINKDRISVRASIQSLAE